MDLTNSYRDFSYYYDDMMQVVEYELWYQFMLPYITEDDQILDLACGTGTLPIILASAGYMVSGLDLSYRAIFLADEKARINHVDIDFRIRDMSDFSYSKPFDVITCFFDSINFIPKEKVPKMLDCVDKSLKPGGYFIFDLFTKHKLEEIDGDDFTGELTFANYRWKTRVENETVYHEIEIQDHIKPFTETYVEYYHDYNSLLDPRFELIKMVTDFSDECDLENGERLLIVLKKK